MVARLLGRGPSFGGGIPVQHPMLNTHSPPMPMGQAAACHAMEMSPELPTACPGPHICTLQWAGVAGPPQVPVNPLTLTKSWIWGFSAMLGGGCWLNGGCGVSVGTGAQPLPAHVPPLGAPTPTHTWPHGTTGDALPWGPGHHCCCQPESSKGGSWHHQLQRLLPGHPTCAACALQGFMPPASAATHPGRCQMLGTRLCCAQLPLPIAGSCTPTPGQYERPCQRLPSPVPPWAPSPGTPAHQ